MQVQYVVDFDVRSRTHPTAPAVHDVLLRHVQEWLETGHEGVPDLAALPADGSCALTRREPHPGSPAAAGPRQLSWHRVATASSTAQRLDLRVPVQGVPVTHVTGVTLAAGADHPTATLRVVTGRESHGGWIAPAPQTFLRRPVLVRRVVEDPDLVVSAYGRRVDGRRADVTGPAEAELLAEALRRTDRLPVLLVAPAETWHLEFADVAALELPGLANVVCLRSRGARDLVARLGRGLDVPVGGARLVWPHLEPLTHPVFGPERIAARRGLDVVDEVLGMIAPLAVVSRGIDVAYRTTERAARALARLDAQRRLEAATAAGDEHRQVDALRGELDAARCEIEEWVQEVHRLEDEVASLTVALGGLGRVPSLHRVPDWEDAPPLEPDDAGPLLDFLEERSGGRLRFTSGAARSWRKSGYLHPDLMRSALVTLARASVAFADSQGRITGRLTDWFRAEFGLDVATTDLALKQSGRANFEFEGHRLDGVPHVKLGDAKSPRECGRVYFAHQSDPARFVVHHVGVHDL
ncbi:hypothetical protein [Kineococcus sp. G2]|uniref:hypothetical protein n=1 Tax=Kineococcus sp. G2 TaxID=3127484 RepID=UPI00301DBE78